MHWFHIKTIIIDALFIFELLNVNIMAFLRYDDVTPEATRKSGSSSGDMHQVFVKYIPNYSALMEEDLFFRFGCHILVICTSRI